MKVKHTNWIIALGVIIIQILFAGSIYAQQDAMYTQYMFNMLPLNPAYAGSRDVLSMTALYRDQWRGIQGAPQTATFSADAPLAKEKIGVGLTVSNDRISIYNTFGMTGNFAYRIRFERSTLAFGISGGFTQFNANLTSLSPETQKSMGTDDMFNSNLSRLIPTVGFGIYYSSDKFYIGVSMPRLLNDEITPNASADFNKLFRAQQFTHGFLMGGYVFTINKFIKLKPSAIVKLIANTPLQIDINCNLWLYDMVGIGLSYRSLDAPSILLEWQITNNIRLGYAYDWSTRLAAYTYGSSELMLRYEMGYNKNKIVTPRYF